MSNMKTAIGLMSGTSLDGIDVALVHTDGDGLVKRGPFLGVRYDEAFRKQLKCGIEEARSIRERRQRPGNLAALEKELTLRHAAAIDKFRTLYGLQRSDIDIVGFHGQTLLHRPDSGLTVQIGDGQLLADETDLAVVFDMRANDMIHGGQGAPLVPAYHSALAHTLSLRGKPVCFVNIGGISNLTFIGSDGALVAYDSGPGNTLIDQWVEAHAGIPFDKDGKIATAGKVIEALAEEYLANRFFLDNARRSLDRGDFVLPQHDRADLCDGARTLAYVAAAAIVKSAGHLPEKPVMYIVCGGGRLNHVIMKDLTMLAARHGASVMAAEAAGFNGDAMEAEAWAYLAVRHLTGLPLTYPATTGVETPVSGGLFVSPRQGLRYAD